MTRMKATVHQWQQGPAVGLKVCGAVMASGNPVRLVHAGEHPEQHLCQGNSLFPV